MDKNAKKVDELLSLAAGKKHALIMPHNYADPDAIAAALALKVIFEEKLGLASTISFDGVVGRQENKVLCDVLSLNVSPASSIVFDDYDLIALVDCQPGAGNNALPDTVKADVVVDHHPSDGAIRGGAFVDIRADVGASATILAEYLIDAGIDITPDVATALVYGIKTDSLNLAVKTKKKDLEAYLHLFPLADKDKLKAIESAQLPTEYFATLNDAIEGALVYDHIVVADLDSVDNPGLIGEFADLFLRLIGAETSLCFGVFDEILMISIRTMDTSLHAGRIMKFAVEERGTAGGHAAMAGGQIPLIKETQKEKREHIKTVRDRVFSMLAIEGKRGKSIT